MSVPVLRSLSERFCGRKIAVEEKITFQEAMGTLSNYSNVLGNLKYYSYVHGGSACQEGFYGYPYIRLDNTIIETIKDYVDKESSKMAYSKHYSFNGQYMLFRGKKNERHYIDMNFQQVKEIIDSKAFFTGYREQFLIDFLVDGIKEQKTKETMDILST